MTTETENRIGETLAANPEPLAAAEAPSAPASIEPTAPNQPLETPTAPGTVNLVVSRGRISKVSLLPVEIREYVNEQLLYGTPPCIIVEALEDKGFPGFQTRNINTWKLGGFQVWLRHHQSAVQQAEQRDAAMTFAQKTGCRLDEALYQLSLQNLFQASSHLDLPAIIGQAKDKAGLFCRLNADAIRLLRVGAGLKKFVPQPGLIGSPSEEDRSTGSGRKGGLTTEERDAVAFSLGILPIDPEPPATTPSPCSSPTSVGSDLSP